jgi:hypothetical protein
MGECGGKVKPPRYPGVRRGYAGVRGSELRWGWAFGYGGPMSIGGSRNGT